MSSPSDASALQTVVEPDLVRPSLFWGTGTAAIVVIVASVVVALGLLRAFERPSARHPSPPQAATAEIDGIEQTLIRNARRGLDEEARQAESLRHFGWVDRSRGVARIPIDRAMDLVGDPAFMARAFPAGRAAESRTTLESPAPLDGGTR